MRRDESGPERIPGRFVLVPRAVPRDARITGDDE